MQQKVKMTAFLKGTLCLEKEKNIHEKHEKEYKNLKESNLLNYFLPVKMISFFFFFIFKKLLSIVKLKKKKLIFIFLLKIL